MISLALVSMAAGAGVLVAGGVAQRAVKTSRKRRRGRALDRDLARPQADRAAPAPTHLPLIEKSMAELAFGPIRKAYASTFGEVFAGFSVFRIGAAIRMDLTTRKEWALVTPFYKGLALRHLWQQLRDLTRSLNVSIVVDGDTPQQSTWTEANTNQFKDRGTVPPWANGGATIGTLAYASTPVRKLTGWHPGGRS